jgi:hypothetical protein
MDQLDNINEDLEPIETSDDSLYCNELDCLLDEEELFFYGGLKLLAEKLIFIPALLCGIGLCFVPMLVYLASL